MTIAVVVVVVRVSIKAVLFLGSCSVVFRMNETVGTRSIDRENVILFFAFNIFFFIEEINMLSGHCRSVISIGSWDPQDMIDSGRNFN